MSDKVIAYTNTERILKEHLKVLEKIEINTRRKHGYTLEFKMTEDSQYFDFDEPINLQDDEYLLGLTSLAVYNSVFNITKENNKLVVLFNFIDENNTFDDSTELELPPGAYEIVDLNETLHRLLREEREKELTDTDGNITTEKYKIVDLDEFAPDTDYPINITADNSTMKCCIRLKKGYALFFTQIELKKLLGFKTDRIIAPPPEGNQEYYSFTSDHNIDIMPISKVHLCCDVIDGSLINGKSSSALFSFNLDKAPGYLIYKEPYDIHYKRIRNSSLNKIHFYLIDDNDKPVSFNGESITFTLKLIRS